MGPPAFDAPPSQRFHSLCPALRPFEDLIQVVLRRVVQVVKSNQEACRSFTPVTDTKSPAQEVSG